MVKVYPESSETKYELYYFMRSVICGCLLCSCTWVGMIVLIVSAIENDKSDGSI